MSKRYFHLVAAGCIAALAVSPSALALAAKKPKHPSSCASAVCVYREPNVPGSGGPSYGGGGGSGAGTGNAASGRGGSAGGSSGGAVAAVRISPTSAKKLQRLGGKDKPVLKALATNPGSGRAHLRESAAGPLPTPSAFGSTFDTSSGLGVLVAAVLGTGLLVICVGGVSRRRRPRR